MPCEHEGHRQRLKERFVKTGLEDFEPHVILELLTFYSVPRKDTNPLGHELINRFGSLSEVLDASVEELMKVKGVTLNTAVLISMIPQIARRYLEEKAKAVNVVGGCDDLAFYLMPHFVGRTVETVILVGLDNKNKIISSVIVAEGGRDHVEISKNRIIREIMRIGATRVAIGHNHPRGFAAPSDDDVAMTVEIRELLESVGVEFVDHLICGEDDYVSMRASGLGF